MPKKKKFKVKKNIKRKQKPKFDVKKTHKVIEDTLIQDYNGILLMPSEFNLDFEVQIKTKGINNKQLAFKITNFCNSSRHKTSRKQLLNNFQKKHGKTDRIEVEKILKDLSFCSIVKSINKRNYKIEIENDKEIKNITCNFKRYNSQDIYYCLKFIGDRLINTKSELFNMPLICKDIQNKLVIDKEYNNQIKYVDNLEESEQDFVFDYSTIKYVEINEALRSDDDTYDDEVNALKIIYNNAPKVKNSFHVFRDTSDFQLGSKKFSELKKNDTFIDKGLLSTTWRPTYIGTNTYGCCIVVIKIPIGKKVLFIENISEVKSENEVLLQNGSKFKVISNRVKKVLDLNSIKRINSLRFRKFVVVRIIKLQLLY